MLNEDLKKQIDASQSVLDAFDDKLNHLKQTVQNLNEKFNERNKIEVYLSKNGIKSDLVSKILNNSSFSLKVNFAVDTNEKLKLKINHHNCIVDNYKNEIHRFEAVKLLKIIKNYELFIRFQEVNRLNEENLKLKMLNDEKILENMKLAEELNSIQEKV